MAAKSPALRSINTEALQDAQDSEAFSALAEQLNGFMKDTGNAFDDLLGQNRREQIEKVRLTTTAGSALSNVKFKNRLPSAPTRITIGQIRPTATSASLVLTVGAPIWRLTGDGLVQIDHIGGLAASTQYDVTFEVK